ncbi:putative Zinc finger C2H2-type [Septoria linicola]|nr:putative Zinc finger C2H2-type [Septoria linicola]
MSRPASSQHRLSVGSPANSLPTRNSYSRSHSHTTSLGSVNATNRINRRKSSTFSKPTINSAALDSAVADGSIVNRRSSMSKSALASLNDGHAAIPSSLPQYASVPEDVAVEDGPSLSSFQQSEKAKAKMRRASDGTRLSKKEKAATGELKCEHCGKAYKHGSCLTKHLWEHTPQWQVTSKLLISKHQQVQLLEAASVLVAMNQDSKDGQDSDDSSSPAASGSSGMRDEDLSSNETTPPPHSENAYRDSKRFSGNSSIYSRSYQSVFSNGSAPNGDHGFSHHRQWSASSNSRPMTANTSIAESYRGDEDPQDLAAAVGLLSCSYGTPKSGPTAMGFDVPPVPPLPAKYQNQNQTQKFSNYRTQGDVEMEDDDDSDNEPHNGRNDEAEYGMFGNMDA